MASGLPSGPDAVKRTHGLMRLDEPLSRSLAERLMFYPTLTINGFHSSYLGPKSKTIVPHEAFVKCDVRLVESQGPEEILAKIEAHVLKHAPDVEFVRLGGMRPSKTPVDSPRSDLVRRAVAIGQGREPLLYPSCGASLPEYVSQRYLVRIPMSCRMPTPMNRITRQMKISLSYAFSTVCAPALQFFTRLERP